MKHFFISLLATVLGIILSTFIMVLITIGIISAVASSAKDKTVKVKENSILTLTLNQPFTDRASDNPFENFDYGSFDQVSKTGLNDFLKNIKKAKNDKNIRGIFLNLSSVPSGAATLEEIRNALLDFKKSGKFIISYADTYAQSAYYIATVADKIYLNPEGMVEFRGMASEIMFYKGALEKLGVEPQVIRHGKFKSAVEPFVLDKMSDENRRQIKTYVGSIWNKIVEGISEQRNISVSNLMVYADSMYMRNAQAAVHYKMIDGVRYYDELMEELKDSTDIKKKEDLRLVNLSEYNKAPDPVKKKISKNKIALIYASGTIDMGKSDAGSIGSQSLSETIRKAREDSTVKAIVLRVNSPGGSALASEVIWREMTLAKKVKPVVVSMGDVAASGGYYISAPADVIVAQPNTITGSIGVFGLMFNAKKLMNEKLGLTFDTVLTNDHADIGSMYRPLTKPEETIIQGEVNRIYDAFVKHVAEGRKMDAAGVDSIGQGRVWSGINAKELGLVDELGGIDKAIEIAAEKAGLKEYRITELPEQKEFIEILMDMVGQAKASLVKKELGENYEYYARLQQIMKMKGVQAVLPYEIKIY